MSRCARIKGTHQRARAVAAAVVPWSVDGLSTMLLVGALFCARCVHGRNNGGVGLAGWKDWPLDEGARPASSADAESTLLVRRITPKSVFVAPGFGGGCSDGYRQDGTGRCVKPVKVNQAAQLDFILHKLNSKFGPSKSNNKSDAGPFRVDIPLAFTTHSNGNATEAPSPPINITTTITTTTVSEAFTTVTTPVWSEAATTEPPPMTTETPSLPFVEESDDGPRQENAVKRQPLIIVVADHTGYEQSTTTSQSTENTTEVALDTDYPPSESPSPSQTTKLSADEEETSSVETMTVTTETILLERVTLTPPDENAWLTTPPPVEVDDQEYPDEEFQQPEQRNSTDFAVAAKPVHHQEAVYGPSNDKQVVAFTEEDALTLPRTPEPPTLQLDCESEPSLEEYAARVVNAAATRCRPVQVTTPDYPVATPITKPYYTVRFPGDNVSAQSPYSYSDSSSLANSNGFVRFPDRLSISSSYQPLPYATKVWSDGLSMSPSTSSDAWYSPSSSSTSSLSWFPFLQPHKSRPNRYNSHSYFHYENGGADRHSPSPQSPTSMSVHVFRKQFRRPATASWAGDKRISWPYTSR